MPVLRAVGLPWCAALLAEGADAPPGRWFAAWRAGGAGRWLLGQGVLDEFGTLSSPVLLAHPANLGRVYDAGIALAHRRDPELPLDAGWPPLCLGSEALAAAAPADLETPLLAALAGDGPAPDLPRPRSRRLGAWELVAFALADATVLATDAPLLPRQLRRLGAVAATPVTLALATGNRIVRSPDGAPRAVRAAAEDTVAELAAAARELLA